MPILLEPFSHERSFCRGQNPVIIAAVRRAFGLTGRRPMLVVDRGVDAIVLLDDWPDHARTAPAVARSVMTCHRDRGARQAKEAAKDDAETAEDKGHRRTSGNTRQRLPAMARAGLEPARPLRDKGF